MTPIPQPRKEQTDEQPVVLDLGTLSWPTVPDQPTRVTPRPEAPLHCRLHLWHQFRLVHAPGVDDYPACRHCGRLAPKTIFDAVVP